jgi:hypothetical protein
MKFALALITVTLGIVLLNAGLNHNGSITDTLKGLGNIKGNSTVGSKTSVS